MGIKINEWTITSSGLNVTVSAPNDDDQTFITQDGDRVLVNKDALEDLITVLQEVRDGIHG